MEPARTSSPLADRDRPICVTGANGFVASRLCADLLADGHHVRGTVRSLAKPDAALLRALPGAAERLTLLEADLQTSGAFDAAVAGCAVVMHTASPYTLEAKDPQRDLVDPAVGGTRNVLASCARAGVRRVVLTSSMAAITDEPEADHVLTEADWNTRSSLKRNPYYLSKTLAEREAWRMVEQEGAPFDLVVINPFLIIGPSLVPGLNTSNQLFVDLFAGVYPGVMNLAFGFVDVRDVARAHVLAATTPKAHGRYICANEPVAMRDLVALLAGTPYAAGAKLPRLGLDCAAGDFAVRLGSYFQPKGVGSYLRTHVGRTPRFDASKAKRELGLAFRPSADTIRETLADLARWGHLPSRAEAGSRV